ncbi:MAG: 3-oxoacyl-ACP synthase III [Planctomycetes bacterium]|nr:3-oxoacyl-ACP synthase III [Planctomycetota bacterium]
MAASPQSAVYGLAMPRYARWFLRVADLWQQTQDALSSPKLGVVAGENLGFPHIPILDPCLSTIAMHFRRVCLESFGYTLPDEVVTTAEIEVRLAPLYERLRLPEGRLELMTGIRERRFFPPGTLPSEISIESARRAIEASGIDRHFFGALIHGSVCRDYLEPATACRVHHALGLPSACMIYDVSNACLGLLTGVLHIANMIELGQIRAGIVVGTECGHELVENTIALLNSDLSLTRDSIKHSMASLTIGSASAAMVLCDKELSQTGNRLTAAMVHCDASRHDLCRSRGMETVMQTDSEELMRRGVAIGAETFSHFLAVAGWEPEDVDRTFCHQVGVAHRKLMFESLQLDPKNDFATLEILGNTGAVALPVTMAMGIEQDRLQRGDRVAMLGIGSGINCQMLAVEWQQSAAKKPTQRTSLALESQGGEA